MILKRKRLNFKFDKRTQIMVPNLLRLADQWATIS